MTEKATLNRFPLFGLFCYRAALRMGKSETQSELLGYSMAVLYAIFKSQAQRRREGKAKKEERELPEEAKQARTDILQFGGHIPRSARARGRDPVFFLDKIQLTQLGSTIDVVCLATSRLRPAPVPGAQCVFTRSQAVSPNNHPTAGGICT